jgi:hypothetical protein
MYVERRMILLCRKECLIRIVFFFCQKAGSGFGSGYGAGFGSTVLSVSNSSDPVHIRSNFDPNPGIQTDQIQIWEFRNTLSGSGRWIPALQTLPNFLYVKSNLCLINVLCIPSQIYLVFHESRRKTNKCCLFTKKSSKKSWIVIGNCVPASHRTL